MSAGDQTWRETLAFHVYRSVAWLARALPEGAGRRLFRLGGRLAFELVAGIAGRGGAQPGAGAGSRSRRPDRAYRDT